MALTAEIQRDALEERIVGKVAHLRTTFERGQTRPLAWRRQQLERLLALVQEKEEDIHAALRQDLGKCRFESMMAETAFVSGELKRTLRALPRWMKSRRFPTPMVLKPAKAEVKPEPLGVVLIIAPWNYPFQLAVGPLAGAIAAGNCAVIKPSELTPSVSAGLAEWLHDYLDPDCFSVVEGDAQAATYLLAQRFDHIFYTGGGAVGRIVMQAAARHLTPVTLELGGKSPCVVTANANLDVAARRIVWGKFVNAGQTCVAPDYVLVHGAVKEALIEKLAAAIRSFYGDDPKQSTDYARIVNDKHMGRLQGLMRGQSVVCGGDFDMQSRYVAPTVLRDVAPEAPIMQEEIFGPILPVLEIPDTESAIAFINARPKPLALYVFSGNRQESSAVLNRTSSGGACVNDVVTHLGVPDLPFGGVGPSGMGNYHGKASFDTFSHHKGVLKNATWVDPSLRYAPYTAGKLKWMKKLLGA